MKIILENAVRPSVRWKLTKNQNYFQQQKKPFIHQLLDFILAILGATRLKRLHTDVPE